MLTRTLADFNVLVDKYKREIFGYLWRMMRDTQDAEDALQETFLRAFRSFSHLENDSNLRAWLYKIATNVAYTQLRIRTRYNNRITDLNEFILISTIDPNKRDLLEAVLQTVQGLPNKQKAALMLRKYQGLTYEEIAIILDSSPDSARANVYQALKKLRFQFSEEQNDQESNRV